MLKHRIVLDPHGHPFADIQGRVKLVMHAIQVKHSKAETYQVPVLQKNYHRNPLWSVQRMTESSPE